MNTDFADISEDRRNATASDAEPTSLNTLSENMLSRFDTLLRKIDQLEQQSRDNSNAILSVDRRVQQVAGPIVASPGAPRSSDRIHRPNPQGPSQIPIITVELRDGELPYFFSPDYQGHSSVLRESQRQNFEDVSLGKFKNAGFPLSCVELVDLDLTCC
ncbi:unnamed protein product [Periconia digitata]|uniref:Uncharacterized protein n=1 Tax=Periconia digitata TaxID=1303443 RepID=A0A9W4XU74_9PLEO|nr:unnamed protein product [Periconia digitata]